MAPLSAQEFTEWKKKRTRSMVVFVFQQLFIGMEFSVTFTTLWTYLKEMKTDDPLLYYSLVSAAFLLASLTLSVPIGRFVDKHRRIRLTFFTVNCLVIVGNFMYAIPYSPWFLVFGRLLSGTAGPLRSVMSGEIARSFRSEELSSKFTWMGMSYGIGFMVGPTINIFFRSLHVSIGEWVITCNNVPGIIMGVLFTLATTLGYFFLADLSKIFDLKENSQEPVDGNIGKYKQGTFTKEDPEMNGGSSNSENGYFFLPNENKTEATPLLRISQPTKPSMFGALRMILWSNYDVTLLLVFSFLESYFSLSFIMWLSLIVIEKLEWTVTATNLVMTGTSICSLIPCIVMARWTISNKHLFYVAVFSQFAMVLMYIIVEIFFHRVTDNVAVNVFLWSIFDILYASLVIVEEVFLVGTLAKMVSSDHQVFADGVRLTVYRLGAITALSSSALIFEQMDVVAPIHVCIVVVLTICMVMRRRQLKNPVIVIR